MTKSRVKRKLERNKSKVTVSTGNGVPPSNSQRQIQAQKLLTQVLTTLL